MMNKLNPKKPNGHQVRFKEIREILEYSQKEWANILGTLERVIVNIESGKSDPTFNLIKNMFSVFPVDEKWFYMGEGEPFKGGVRRFKDGTRKKGSVDKKFNERVVLVRLNTGLNQSLFANKLGVSRNVISFIEGHRITPTTYLLRELNDKFRVSMDWLFNGEGEMYRKRKQ